MIRVIVLGACIAVSIAVAAAIAVLPQPAPASAARTVATAEVTRGPLRDSKTVTGTLGYTTTIALRAGSADSGTVTAIATAGQTVERGQALYAVDGQPAVLFYGSVPFYRTLRFDQGSSDAVWVEREQAKASADAAALSLSLEEERLAEAKERIDDASSLLADAQASSPSSAMFVELAGKVGAAEARLARVIELSVADLAPNKEVTDANAELAAAHAAYDAARRKVRADLSAARLDAAAARVAIAATSASLADLRRTYENLDSDGIDVDARQIADNLAALGYGGAIGDALRSFQQAVGLPVTGAIGPRHLVIADGPVHIARQVAEPGEVLAASAADGEILDYSPLEEHVTVALPIADRPLVAVGRAAAITLPGGATVAGLITSISSIVTNETIEVTIAIADQSALAGLDVAAVDVDLVSDSREDALSVPIAALLARPEGGFAVEIVGGGASTLTPVTTGLFAAGRVEIAGEGIDAGIRVSVPG